MTTESDQNLSDYQKEVREREQKAVDLNKAGYTLERIAEQLGYADVSGAWRAIDRYYERIKARADEHKRAVELERLDRLQVAVWNRALKGDDRAIATVLRLMERRAKLLGLDEAIKVQAQVVNYDGTRDIDGDIERIVNLLRRVDSSQPLEVEGGTSESGTIATAGELEDLALHGGQRSGQDEDGGGVVSVGSDPKPDDSVGDSSPDLR
jgi:hypothetical protein